MTPRVVAVIDRSALRHNLAQVRRFAPGRQVMAAVKADGYGHGAVEVARSLSDCDAFAVACLEEAVILREAGVRQPIALLEGVLSAEEAQQAVALNLQIVLHEPWQLSLLDQLPAAAGAAQFWFKLDTGMHRLGFDPAAVPSLSEWLAKRDGQGFCGWMTHLACADERENPMTATQLDSFQHLLEGLPGPRSIANSAGIVSWPAAHADWVRPGLMLYGVSPVPDQTAAQLGLRPVMQLRSRLIATRRLAAGEPVGYGAQWRAIHDTRIGVVAVGYADGWHRCLPSGTPVSWQGETLQTVGRVSMDMICVELGDCPAQVGDDIVLWGAGGIAVEQIAERAGTLAYEMMCGLTQRVRLQYLDNAAPATR